MTKLAIAILCLSAASVAAQDVAQAQDGFTVPLTHRGMRKWKLKLPAEQWKPVGTAFELAGTLGHDFAAKLEGTRLVIDCDGDGTGDVQAEGAKAFVTLRGKTEDGTAIGYSVRLVNQQGWKFAPGGYRTGKIDNVPIRIIDQNNNGRFDDIGKDAMIVGRGKVATYLSEVVNVGGKLYEMAVARDGSSIVCMPYTGPAGTLKLDCATKGKVLSAIVRSTDGRFSFDGADAGDGFKVPVGAYQLMIGEIGLGKSRVKMVTGKSKPIQVNEGKDTRVCWGGPVRAEFEYKRLAGKVHLSPKAVWYYGAAGEEYRDWVPLGASPEFTIKEPKGKEVARAYFPGSC